MAADGSSDMPTAAVPGDDQTAERTRPGTPPGRPLRPHDFARTTCHETTEPPRHRAAHRLRLARRLRRAIGHRGGRPHPGDRPCGARLRRDRRGAGRRTPARRDPHLLGARLRHRDRHLAGSADRGQTRRRPGQHRRGRRHRAGRVGHQRSGLLRRGSLGPRRRHGAGLDARPGGVRPRGPGRPLGPRERPAAPTVDADLRRRRLRGGSDVPPRANSARSAATSWPTTPSRRRTPPGSRWWAWRNCCAAATS